MKIKLIKLKNFFVTLSLIGLSFLFSCNSNSSTTEVTSDTTIKVAPDTAVASSDTTAPTFITKAADSVMHFGNTHFTHKDSVRDLVCQVSLSPVKISVKDFLSTFEEDNHFYFLFHKEHGAHTIQGLSIDANGSNIETVTLPEFGSPIQFDCSDVDNIRYWLRPSILFPKRIDTFLNDLKKDSFELVNHPERYEIRITPIPKKDGISNYIALELSVVRTKDNFTAPTKRQTNPCPVCNQ